MVCSCVMPSNCVGLKCWAANNILRMRKGNRAVSPSCDRSCVKRADRFASRGYSLKKQTKLGDRMIKQLLNSVIEKYRDLSVSRRSIICLSFRLRQIIDLLATDKSRSFCSTSSNNCSLASTSKLYYAMTRQRKSKIQCF